MKNAGLHLDFIRGRILTAGDAKGDAQLLIQRNDGIGVLTGGRKNLRRSAARRDVNGQMHCRQQALNGVDDFQ